MIKPLLSARFNLVQLTWVASMFYTTVGSIVLWQSLWTKIEMSDLHSFLFFTSLPIFLFCFFNLLLTPFMVFHYIHRPLLVFLIIISVGCSYFMLRYHIVIDRNVVQNFFETSQAEQKYYFSIPFFSTLVFLGILPAAAFARFPGKKNKNPLTSFMWWLSHISVTFVLLVVVTMTFYKDYATLLRNNIQIADQTLPFNFVSNTHDYLKRKLNAQSKLLRAVAKETSHLMAKVGKKPELMMVVVDETARARNVQLNGCPHPTNPALSRYQNVTSFTTVLPSGTATAILLPCMISPLRQLK